MGSQYESSTLEDGSQHDDCQLMVMPDQIMAQGDRGIIKKPFKTLEYMPGYEFVRKGLSEGLGIKIGNGMQLHAAANIFAGNNCFIIGSKHPRAGKSLSYMIPILSKLMCETAANEKIIGSGPLCLIVCGTNKSGQKLDVILDTLARKYNRSLKAVFLEENDPTMSNYSSKNMEKYDVILATAECVVEMMEKEHSYFSFDRLSYLIFDDAQIILKYKQKAFKTIMDGFLKYVSQVGARECTLQTIFCGNQWSEEMEQSFSSIVESPILIIGSPVQILLYSRFNVQLVKADDNGAFNQFKSILQMHNDVYKVVVVATELDVLENLKSQCQMENINVKLFGKGRVGGEDLAEAKWEWSTAASNDRVIILATDINVRELKISSAFLLIHYDIPVDNLRTFAIRFSFLWSHSRDLTKEGEVDYYQSPHLNNVISYVILPPNLPDQHKIVLKLQKLGVSVPKKILMEAQKVKEQRMESTEICPGIKYMGKCVEFDALKCPYRHYFVEQDFSMPSILPRTGQVELRIKEFITPNLYRAQIIRYGEKDRKTNRVIKVDNYEDEVVKRSLELQNLAIDKPTTFAPGTSVVISTREKTENRFIYTRAEIMSIMTRNSFGFPTAVLVNCYDIGETRTVKVNGDDEDVFAMPPEMLNHRRCSVEVVLANTAPPLEELEFRTFHLSKAREHFKRTVLEAEIALSIQNTIWVKRLVERKKLKGGILAETWDATSQLVKEQIVVRNPGHLALLYKLCEDANFSCDLYKNVDTEIWKHEKQFQSYFYQSTNLAECKWAYLVLCRDEDPTSTTAVAKWISSNGAIHVIVTSFEDQMINLEDEMDEEIRVLKRNRNYNLEENFHSYYEVGMVVAALFEFDNIYHRGLITKVVGCKSSVWTFKISLLDLGGEEEVSMPNIFPIPIKYVRRLPFQIIRINLAHIKPKRRRSATENRFSDNITNFLIPQGESIEIEVVALEKVGNDNVHGCNSYNGFVFGETQEIGEKFVQDKVATFISDDWLSRINYVKNALLEKLGRRVDALLKIQNDDDDYSDTDSDLDINFYEPLENLLSIMLGEEVKADFKSESYVEEVKSDDDDEPGLPQNYSSNERISTQPNQTIPTSNSTTKKVPRVDWYEKNDNLFLRVRIPDIKEYGCIVSQDKKELHFKTVDPPDYEFVLKLVKKVNENPMVTVFGQYCEIKLKKRMRGVKWVDDLERPTITPTPGLHWLKYDLDFAVQEEIVQDTIENEESKIEPILVDYELLQQQEDSEDEILNFDEGVEENDLHAL